MSNQKQRFTQMIPGTGWVAMCKAHSGPQEGGMVKIPIIAFALTTEGEPVALIAEGDKIAPADEVLARHNAGKFILFKEGMPYPDPASMGEGK